MYGFELEKDKYDYYKLKNEAPILQLLNQLFAKKRLSKEIMGYLIEIIQRESDPKLKDELLKRLHQNMPYLIQHDYLYSYSTDDMTPPISQSMNVFYAHWMVLMHLKEEPENHLDFEEENIKKRWVYLLRCLLSELPPPP